MLGKKEVEMFQHLLDLQIIKATRQCELNIHHRVP